MSQSANDWASTDPGKNMTLEAADQFRNQLAASLGLQFGSRFLVTQYGIVITEAELRANSFILPLPVSLYGTLVPNSETFNINEFQTTLRKAANSDDPTGTLAGILQHVFPQMTGVTTLFTRMPAVQNVIASAMKTI